MGTGPRRREDTQQQDSRGAPSQPGQEAAEYRIAVPDLQRGAGQQGGDGKAERKSGMDGNTGKERDHCLESRHNEVKQRGQDGKGSERLSPFFHA